MSTYLVAWNTKKWPWTDIEEQIAEIKHTGKTAERWSCGNNKSIIPGDRIFLVKVGSEPRGIAGSGFATSFPYTEQHWNDENKEALYINIDFDVLLNPEKDPILTLDILRADELAQQSWTPQSSGIAIRAELTEKLEAVWFDFLNTQPIRRNPFAAPELQTRQVITEGTQYELKITAYERNPRARQLCLQKFGYACVICGFNFEDIYGKIGVNFIHVHHLTPIATVGKLYEISPENDLRPVCPNCHAIIHKRIPPFEIDEVKMLLQPK